jgi:hypothetical protein
MIRKTMFAFATVAAIAAAALIPTEASAAAGARVVAWVAITAIGAWLRGRLRRHRGDRTQLLALGARPRQGICLLLNRHRQFQ